MLSKRELKTLVKYKQDKYRKEDKVFVVEGVKLSEELLESDYKIIHIYATENWIEDNKTTIRPGVEVREITEEELQKISLLSTPNQVYCLVERKTDEKKPIRHGLTIVLDGIKDPGNLGTIVRLADWYSVERIICSHDSVDIYNPKTVQSTMGSIFRVKVEYQDLENLFATLPKEYPIYGSLVESGKSIYDTEFTTDSILIIGSESHGISQSVRKYINQNITIPRHKSGTKPESLNAAIATAIILSTILR